VFLRYVVCAKRPLLVGTLVVMNGRTLILVNPCGVRVRRSDAWAQARTAADGRQVVVLETEYAGHAEEYCRTHAGEFHKIIAVGGDGFLSEVVNGALGADVAVAPLPGGSGNDFAKALPGYPASLDQLLASQRCIRVDVGRITFDDGESRCFLSEAGTGLDAACVRYIPNWLRKISASRAYDIGALRGVIQYRPFAARVEMDGEVVKYRRLQLLAVCNTAYFGDGMPIAPDARFDDGVFHVFALGEASRLEILKNFTSLRKGTHIHHPKSIYRACRNVRIEADRRLDMCVDGDLVERTPQTWEIQPGALRVIAPDGASYRELCPDS
jgi:diacylglycerol kinase (ATP)